MTKLTYPVLFASLALAYGHALAVDTSVPKAEDYEAVPESEMPKQPKDDQTGKLKPKFPVKIDTHAMGRLAASHLFDLINGKSAFTHVIETETELVIRGTA